MLERNMTNKSNGVLENETEDALSISHKENYLMKVNSDAGTTLQSNIENKSTGDQHLADHPSDHAKDVQETTDTNDEQGAKKIELMISSNNNENNSNETAESVKDLESNISFGNMEPNKNLPNHDSDSEDSTFMNTMKYKSRKYRTVSDSNSESQSSIPDVLHNTKDLEFEDELKITKQNMKTRKRITIPMSDSEDDEEPNSSALLDNATIGEQYNYSKATDSDDDDTSNISNSKDNSDSNGKNRRNKSSYKKFTLGDSESEDETTRMENGKIKETPIYTTNAKGELISEETVLKNTNWSALCDSESSADEVDNEVTKNSDIDKDISDEGIVKPLPYKKKRKTKEEGPKKMTGKEAAELRTQIQSESQRMVRESRISLPYHRPKSFTLKEFLSRRPKSVCAVPLAAKTPPSIAMKMSIEQLQIISKKLEERHKEVKEFYKSNSEDSDDDTEDVDFIPADSDIPIETSNDTITTKSNDITTDKEDCNEQVETEARSKNENDSMQVCDNVVDDEVVNKNNETIEDKLDIVDKITCSDYSADLANDEPLHVDLLKPSEDTNISQHDGLIENSNLEESEGTQTSVTIEPTNDSAKNSEFDENSKTIDTFQHDCSNKNDKILNENLKTFEKSSSNEDLTSNVENTDTVRESDGNVEHNELDGSSDQQFSMDYDFNLDDIENNIEHQNNVQNDDNETQMIEDVPKKHSEQPTSEDKDLIDFAELDEEIENFKIEQEKPKLSKLELLKEKLANIQPRLSSMPNNIIDLDSVPEPTQITRLMERFARHTAKQQYHHKDNVKLNVVSVETGGEIHKETVAVRVDDEEDLTIEEKPGVRLQRLRNELQSQITQQKIQLWQNKAKKVEVTEIDPDENEKTECTSEDQILDNEDEEDMTESSEDDFDDDEVDEKETEPKKKSMFVDDEADESDIEEHFEAENEEEDEDVDDESEDEEAQGMSDREENKETDRGYENRDNNIQATPTSKKPLKRIIKAFSEDSDDDDDIPKIVSNVSVTSTKSSEDLVTQDDYIPPYQPPSENTTVRECFKDKSNVDLKFLTPISYITGLQNLNNSASKVQSSANVPSPLREAGWHATLQKKLDADSLITESQAEAMAQLCSETFSNSQDSSQEVLNGNSTGNNEKVSTSPSCSQDLLNVCSGDFEEEPTTQELLHIGSGNFTGTSEESEALISKNTVTHTLNAVEEVKTLGEDQDMIISQLINEEEMEAFKKKFVSPIFSHSQRVIALPEQEVAGSGGFIDSDEDEDVLEVRKKKTNQKKLTFSDDSSSEDEEQEEEIDLHDEDDEDDIPIDVNYDSEENEVEYTDEKVSGNENVKLSDFFEDEAELSESEWGSADEDEKDLDRFEVEQGDEEKIDEKQMRTDLERIHMRRMLDDDTREVKLLQEMLLENGELSGAGRARQFKWKNIDSVETEQVEQKNSDDEIAFDEDESEEQWRKRRHEREMFLKEKHSQQLEEEDDFISGSEILKIGQKVIQRSLINSQGNAADKAIEDTDVSVRTGFTFAHKRGSFLSRGETVLQRVAEYNKITTTETAEILVAQKAKNSRNFLFQTVEGQGVTASLSIINKKRKVLDGTPRSIKKLRLTDNLSPAVKRKEKKSSAKAKLFGLC